MKVQDVMTRDVCMTSPEETIEKAARLMDDMDVGALPVGDGERLVGMITDRDIAVRAVAKGNGPKTKVADIMSSSVKYCYSDEDLSHISDNMADIQLRRLPVVDRDKRLVGILSLADIATCSDNKKAATALSGISRPHGQAGQPSA